MLSPEEVERVSLLARLRLTADELSTMTEQLGHVVEYVKQLDELDTDDVVPLAHALDRSKVFAADKARASLPRDQALANAPKRDDECYRVPAVLGE